MAWWWSWLLTAWGVTGLFLAGRRRTVGWAVGLSAQAAWIAYAVTTRQWGFVVSAVAYGSVYAKNWLAWRTEPTSPIERSNVNSYQPGDYVEARAMPDGTFGARLSHVASDVPSIQWMAEVVEPDGSLGGREALGDGIIVQCVTKNEAARLTERYRHQDR